MRTGRARYRGLVGIGLALVAGAAASAQAQTPPQPRAGLELARRLCAGCHAVERGNLHSIEPRAPAFTAIAGVRGVSARALAAALQTSHRVMPDIVLTPSARADVVAYILSLRPD